MTTPESDVPPADAPMPPVMPAAEQAHAGDQASAYSPTAPGWGVPQGVPPQGYAAPQGVAPQGVAPQGYAAPQGVPPQGHAAPPQGYAAPPQVYAPPQAGPAAPPYATQPAPGYAPPSAGSAPAGYPGQAPQAYAPPPQGYPQAAPAPYGVQTQHPYPYGYAAKPPAGGTSWGLGFLAYIPIPVLGVLVAGIVMASVYRSQARHGAVAEGNARNAGNWGLTYIAITIVCFIIAIAAVAGFRDDGAPLAVAMYLVWLAAGVTHLVLIIMGLVRASAGRVLNIPFAIPFIRA